MVAAAIGSTFAPNITTRRYWIAGILCAVLVDLDALGRPFGRGDLAVLGGHRTLTHSLAFAVLAGLVVAWVAFRHPRWDGFRGRIALYLTLATASHGVLDAFASYGSGVAFFAPFSTVRYSAQWRPLRALNEIYWVWMPALLAFAASRRIRRAKRSAEANAAA